MNCITMKQPEKLNFPYTFGCQTQSIRTHILDTLNVLHNKQKYLNSPVTNL